MKRIPLHDRGRTGTRRRGLLTPMVAIALLVAMAALALVLDRVWLDTTSVELLTAAEAAATAAAGSLADDDLLREQPDHAARVREAAETAVKAAAANLATGQPVQLNADEDVRFGRLVRRETDGGVQLVETNYLPTTVAVAARRTRSRNNPVALFMQGLTGHAVTDVVRMAQATLDDRVLGLRPFDGVAVPLLPLAILELDETGQRDDTWQVQLEARQGPDAFRWDAETKTVVPGADGIPEMLLTIPPARSNDLAGLNAVAIDLGTGLRPSRLARQVQDGVSAEELAGLGGVLHNEDGRRAELRAASQLPNDMLRALYEQRGRCRAVLLYRRYEPAGERNQGRLSWSRLAAVRVMDVRSAAEGGMELVVQPGVLVTRTAVLPGDIVQDDADAGSTSGSGSGAARPATPGNSQPGYVWKIHLTR